MNLQQIKQAVDGGKIVCWKNDNYLVEKGGPWGYWIVKDGQPIIGLTENSFENFDEFFILETL